MKYDATQRPIRTANVGLVSATRVGNELCVLRGAGEDANRLEQPEHKQPKSDGIKRIV